MCGLVGFINRDIIKLNINNFVGNSLVANSLRGTDGSGLFLVGEKGETSIYKRPLPGWDLAQLIPTKSMLGANDKSVFGIIHNRASTNGGNSIETSHPVVHEHITLAHNGVINQIHSLGVPYNTHDSTAIAICMATKGEKETLELLSGSYALLWYNANDQTLNAARNDSRPLYIATTKKSKNLFFASEDGMLLWLAERNNIDLKEINMVKPGFHLKFPLDSKEKQRIKPFTIFTTPTHVPPNNPVIGGNSYTSRYIKVDKDEEFFAEFVGVAQFASRQMPCAKFRHVKDNLYCWVVPVTEELKQKLVGGNIYKLKAQQSRFTESDSADKDAELTSLVSYALATDDRPESNAIDYYHTGDTIKFRILQIFRRGTEGAPTSLTGITDDESMIEVRSFNLPKELSLSTEDLYRGTVNTVIASYTGKGSYILVDPTTILLVNDKTTETRCGWCDEELTAREVINNTAPEVTNSGSLCDTCYGHYETGFKGKYGNSLTS